MTLCIKELAEISLQKYFWNFIILATSEMTFWYSRKMNLIPLVDDIQNYSLKNRKQLPLFSMLREFLKNNWVLAGCIPAISSYLSLGSFDERNRLSSSAEMGNLSCCPISQTFPANILRNTAGFPRDRLKTEINKILPVLDIMKARLTHEFFKKANFLLIEYEQFFQQCQANFIRCSRMEGNTHLISIPPQKFGSKTRARLDTWWWIKQTKTFKCY